MFGDRDSLQANLKQTCYVPGMALKFRSSTRSNFPSVSFLSLVLDMSHLKLSTRNGEGGPGEVSPMGFCLPSTQEAPGSMPRVDSGLDSDVALGDRGRTIRTLRKAKLSLRLTWDT